MSERPWLKWYPSDWRADPALHICSLAARGLWIELLGFMHESVTPGHLLVNGLAPDVNDIASLVNSDAKTINKLLAELERRGVFSRTENGTIISRRMIRDAERSEAGREFVNKRWGKKSGSPTDPNGSKGRRPNKEPNSPPNTSPTTQRLESRSNPQTPFSDIADVTPCPTTGKALVNGYYLERAADMAIEAARINEATWRGDYRHLILWLKADIQPVTIAAAIRRVASKPNYKPPFSLAYFDRAVREQPSEVAA